MWGGRREQTTATAGPSTRPFAKSANGFAQDDKFSREARRTGNDKARATTKATATAVAGMLFGWRSGFLRCAAHVDTVSSFCRNDGFCGVGGENRQRQKQMRGFFPIDFAQGQNDKSFLKFAGENEGNFGFGVSLVSL